MITLRKQDGSGLILLIGVIAALATMAIALVTLTANVQSNAAKQRAKDKSFGVAEAGLDGMMYVLSNNWPTSASLAPDVQPLPSVPAPWTAEASLLRTQGTFANLAEFANPASGHGAFVSAVAYDNSDSNGDGKINSSDAHWDANGDQLMYVQAQGATGSQTTRLIAEVQRTFVPTTFPRGVALFTGANLASNGGDKDKIRVEDSGGQTVVGYVSNPAGLNPAIFEADVAPIYPPKTVPALSTIWPPSLTQQITDMAQAMGRYHDFTASGIPNNFDFSGVCVIKVADGTDVKLANGNTQINSLADPGILMILGGPNVSVNAGGGTVDFWGVMYTEGKVGDSGTPAIHGMLISTSTVTVQGTADVKYNDSAIMKLANKWTLAVQQVSNTWREIQPVYP